MGFSCFGFCFGFPASVVVPVHVLKRKARLKPATTAQFFCDRLRPCCENPSIVLDFAASSSLYDDALFHATGGHPTTRRLVETRERWRSCSRWCNPSCTGSPPTTLARERPGTP